MIVHKISTFNGLLQFCRTEIRNYCRTYRLPPIAVASDDGSMPSDALASFDFVRVRILVSPRLLEYIKPHTNTNRVWAIISAIRHELKHYEQYLFLKKSNRPITKGALDQNDATVIGRLSADSAIKRLSSEQINPILETIGSAAITGLGIAAGFKGFDVAYKGLIKNRKK